MKQVLPFLFVLFFAGVNAQTVTTIAGDPGNPGYNFAQESFANALFTSPVGICVDSAGRLWLVEEAGSRIKYFDFASQQIYTRSGFTGDPFAPGCIDYINAAATSSRYNYPYGIVSDWQGNLYIADQLNHSIRRLSKLTTLGNSQAASTFAGEGQTKTPLGDYVDAKGTNARFRNPVDIAIDSAGVFYVADRDNDCIRKILADGTVSTLAGSPGAGFADGSAANAKFTAPVVVEVLNNKILLVGDIGNSRIRAINLVNLTVSTFAGTGTSGGDDGDISTATFRAPSGIAVDFAGNVFVADGFDGQANTIRKISGNQVTTIAGKYNELGTNNGQDTAARFNTPSHITFNPARNILYVADKGNHVLRKINLSPVAEFSASSVVVPPNAEVTMTNYSLNNPTTYRWEVTPNTNITFAPGYGSNTAVPKISFGTLGTYTIKLVVTNLYGKDSITKTSYINVSTAGGQPIANFIASKTQCSPLDSITISDQSTNSPTSWEWTITPPTFVYTAGTSTSQNIVVKFSNPGMYYVQLKAANSLGSGTTGKTNYISVFPAEINIVPVLHAEVFPNPATSVLNIKLFENSATTSFGIFNLNGQSMMENVIMGNDLTKVDISKLAPGVYVVFLYNGEQRLTQRFIKQ